jgi:HAE1 family hydrophobic/amphiphilic exporter-1
MNVNPIIRFAVERRVTMAMAVVGIMVLGWLSLTRLPLEFLPSFSFEHISVDAPYPSSSPAETERLIVRPLEDGLGTISGIESLTATATSSSGSVHVGFAPGTDMNMAAVEVRDRVDRVRNQLPSDLERVRIRRFQTSNRPVFRFNLTAPWERDRLYRFVDEVVVRRLLRLEGVADVQVRGDETRQLQIDLVSSRLAAHGVDVRDVASVLRANHLTRTVGTVREGPQSFLVQVDGRMRTLEEFRALPLGDNGLRIGDVAEVSLAYPEREDWDFLNGTEALSVRIYKASTANLLAMIDRVKAELDEIKALPEAEELDINIFRDDSDDVRNGLAELRNTGLLGGFLAIFFMFLFLRRVRTTLLIAIAIPVSLVVTFAIMYLSRQAGWTDLTLNIMTLMGLMLAIGMLVDNSIVVIESVFRHHNELGEDGKTATLRGASEVVLPIFASTITTMCVFLPMVFMTSGGRFAMFMENIGLTVVVVMAASFVVAVTVVPMVSARILSGESSRAFPLFDRATEIYDRTLRFMLRHRLAFALLIALVLGWSWNLYQNIGRSFSPPSYERQLSVQVDMPKAFSMDQKRELFDEVYRVIDEHREELEIADVTHGFQRSAGRSRSWRGSNRFDLYLIDEKRGARDTGAIRDRIEELLPQHPGVTFTVARAMRGRHSSTGANIEMQLAGDRMEILEPLSKRVVAGLGAVPGLKDVDSSLESGDEEIHILPDRERTLQAGMSSQTVGMSISSALSSRPITYFEVGDRELDVVVQHRESDRRTLDQLKTLPLRSSESQLPIGAVADFDTAPGARSIQRSDRRSTVTITADVATGTPSFMAERMAQQAVEEMNLPAGYELKEGDDWRSSSQDSSDAVFMLLFAIVLVYMVMAALFESFAQPFTIMLSVPFAFIGVGIVMKLAGQPRSSTADMGLIILAGLVVNNAIVLIDHINRLRRSGLPRNEAIVLGGRHRLRPILMTAMTTILGLSPMVAPFFLPQFFGAVEGRAAFWAPVGLVILGGLATSTFLTVMVTPVVYSLIDDLTRLMRRIAADALRHPPTVAPAAASPASTTSPKQRSSDRWRDV